jgi:hypothetical protein
MFDFSFSELMVVMVVALIVIGPERLPKVARTLGHLWGRAGAIGKASGTDSGSTNATDQRDGCAAFFTRPDNATNPGNAATRRRHVHDVTLQ